MVDIDRNWAASDSPLGLPVACTPGRPPASPEVPLGHDRDRRRAGGRNCSGRGRLSQKRSVAPERIVEPQVEGYENHDDANVPNQSSPKVVPEEQDVDADNDAYKRKHVDHGG